jgi:hypothetical protein
MRLFMIKYAARGRTVKQEILGNKLRRIPCTFVRRDSLPLVYNKQGWWLRMYESEFQACKSPRYED